MQTNLSERKAPPPVRRGRSADMSQDPCTRRIPLHSFGQQFVMVAWLAGLPKASWQAKPACDRKRPEKSRERGKEREEREEAEGTRSRRKNEGEKERKGDRARTGRGERSGGRKKKKGEGEEAGEEEGKRSKKGPKSSKLAKWCLSCCIRCPTGQ